MQRSMRAAILAAVALAPGSISCSGASMPEAVRDITIARIAIQQGVELTLMKDGQAVVPQYAAPITGRAGVLHVEFIPRFSGVHDVTALVELDSGSTIATKKIVRQVDGSTLTQSVDFELAASDLPASTSFRVRFVSTTPGDSGGEGAPAEYPPAALQPAPVNLQKSGTLRIKLIPIRYDADGSGRIADSGPTHVEELKKRFLDLYPITAVDITVGDPLPWAKKIASNGDGHADLLDSIVALRAQEHPSDEVYYLGLFATTPTYSEYCGHKCTTGLSLRVAQASQAERRASVAVGYSETRSMETSLHEIGHAHGRQHAPCGVSNADAAFPHEKAALGAEGYSALTKTFYDPAKNYDFMSYCDPAWVSDYTFGALLTRVQEVSTVALPQQRLAVRRPMRMLQVRPNGASKWGPQFSLDRAPTGEPIAIDTTAVDGAKTRIVGYKYNYEDREGGHVLVSPDDARGKKVELDFDDTKVRLDPED